MNFTKFSQEDFNLKEWINHSFTNQKNTNQNVDQFLATLITKLQVFIQEINNSIDDTSQQTIQNFPRIQRDIDILKQESFLLKDQMKSVREDLYKIEQRNTVNDSMKSLLDLDIMKTNLTRIQSSLQEANNWSQLTADMDTILESKDVDKISDHIEAMQSSLALIENEDDNTETTPPTIDIFSERLAILQDFKNKFESFISSDICLAFKNKNFEKSKKFVQIFGQMDRLDEVKKYYYQCEKAKIMEQYNNNKQTIQPTDNKQDEFKQKLIKWLDQSVQVWRNEVNKKFKKKSQLGLNFC
jgi:conserved oligomeric Golgi complex subunit 7